MITAGGSTRSRSAWRRCAAWGTRMRPFPAPTGTTSPPRLPQAVERIRRAVEKGETIGIFGDYDCDGITATVQVFRSFRRRNVTPLVYLPHREREGYGLKEESVRYFTDRRATLLITVDTGISSARELAMAREAGIDAIVVDHHHIPPEPPPAFALLHPGLAPVPGVMPAAAGVAFGVVTALEAAEGKEAWEGREEDLALAAIGTVADLVELRGGNRTLVAEGIAALEGMEGGPLRDLLSQAGIAGAPTSRDIAYRIAPRLNAAGRMADPRIAMRALLGDRESLALLERLNQDRQSQTQEILRELDRTFPAGGVSGVQAFLVAASPDYPAGILGLIAGRLAEAHGRPSMVAQVRGDMCVASLRSIPGYHVTEALRSVSDLLATFGGHAQAAGCTFPFASLPELTGRLQEHAASALSPADLLPQMRIDGILDAGGITLPLCQALGGLEPFGQGNPEPRFLLPAVGFSTLKRVGRNFTHLQGTVGTLKAVGFGLSPLFEKIPSTCDVACRIGVDSWNGNRRPQIFIEDVREAMPVAAVTLASTSPPC